MTDFANVFKLGGSTIALMASLLVATPALAQSASVEDDTGSDIVVTGSSIRGVAPIGSNLVSVGQEAMEKTAAINASQLVNTVPAITTAGSAPLGENSYSYYSPQIHSLAGSGSNTTLAIIDGLRMPGGGTQYSQTDPNIIPTSAIQRVEVLADGASSVYGSDAVAGVVNFITRRTFDGIEVNGRAGFGKDYRAYDLNGIWGTTWETGGVYVAAQYSDQSALNNSDRDFLSRGDYSDVGGSNTNVFSCSPATIRTPLSGSNVYLSPDATTTVPNSVANAPCNTSQYGGAIQSNRRENVFAKVTNEFGDRLRVTGTVNYSHLKGNRDLAPGTVNGVTAFGAGSGVTTGQINPFFLAPAGEPGATQESVSWLALREDGEYGTNSAENETFYATAVAEYEISDNWSVKLSNAFGRSRSTLVSANSFCSACAILGINGTTQANGSTTTTSVPGENIIALNLPLTTANALDVWRPVGTNMTSDAVLRELYSNRTSTEHQNNFFQTKLEAQGSLFTLPAGDVRGAVGGEYMWSTQYIEQTGGNNTGPTGVGASYRQFDLGRKVWSGYAELVVPVVSAEMAIPFVRSLDLNISGRYDHYDDVGSTTNPKFAANWEIIEGLRLRGNYATAFVAPPLAAIGDPAQGYMRSGGAGTSGQILVPVSLFPGVTALPGCAAATVNCQIGLATNQGLERGFGVGPDAKPQKGNSWSIGVDLTPTFLPGFTANVTFWSNEFRGGVTQPSVAQTLGSAALRDGLTLCPSGCTADQIATFTNVANGAVVTGTLPSTVYFMLERDSGNILNLNVQGIDAQFNYRTQIGSAGTFIFGASTSYFTKFKQDFGDEVFDVLNTSGYNTTFPNIQTRARGQVGWELGGFALDTFVNFTGGYRNWSNTSVDPVVLSPAGNPIGGGDKVKSNTTFDLHASYSFEGGTFDGSQVYLDVNNVFDKDPPFYNGNTAGIGVGGWGYNAFVSNPIGRVISVGFRANF